MLVMSSINSGAPFTVYSGIQQTGAGSNGVDRPIEIAKPQLSTARKDRTDYFGHGGGNGPDFFSIPVFQPGGTGPNQGLFGTLGRNSFRGPAFYNYDFAFIKDTPLGRRASGAERMGLQFRAEFFNIFNIANMGRRQTSWVFLRTPRTACPQPSLAARTALARSARPPVTRGRFSSR